MTIRIVKPVRGGTVRAVASKSSAHRLLICAALAREETFIRCQDCSEDIDASARCLQAMGAGVKYEQDGFFVKPIINEKKIAEPDCGESGSTLRFLLPVCGALGIRASFQMRGSLSSRPLSELRKQMASRGCTFSASPVFPLICEGRLTSGKYTLPGNISSQFVSGLLFALPLLEGDSLIHITGSLESRPYVDMTLEALEMFGVKIIEEKKDRLLTFVVPGNQVYRSPGNIGAEGDWSNAAFWLSAGAIGTGSVTCTGLNVNSRQGDRAVTDLLKRFGANVSFTNNGVTVSPAPLHGIEIDASDTPDLVPVLAAIASAAEGKTVIRNAGRLRIKESDRLRTAAASLSSLGADIAETEDGLVIHGKKKLSGGETESFGDHRIAMTAAIIRAACSGPVVIRNAEAVRKSYPGFFDDFSNALGGVWERID